MKNTTKLFLILILSFIIVLFSVINAQQIEVNLLIKTVSLPLAIVLIGALLVGALIVFIVMASNIWQKKRLIKQLNSKVYELENQSEAELHPEFMALKEELKQKDLELSDLKHKLVNQMMSDDTLEINNWSENLEE